VLALLGKVEIGAPTGAAVQVAPAPAPDAVTA